MENASILQLLFCWVFFLSRYSTSNAANAIIGVVVYLRFGFLRSLIQDVIHYHPPACNYLNMVALAAWQLVFTVKQVLEFSFVLAKQDLVNQCCL